MSKKLRSVAVISSMKHYLMSLVMNISFGGNNIYTTQKNEYYKARILCKNLKVCKNCPTILSSYKMHVANSVCTVLKQTSETEVYLPS